MNFLDSLPEGVEKYAETAVFTDQTVPAKLTSRHNTKPGVWGRICVSAGKMRYVLCDEEQSSQMLEAGQYGIIQPQQYHYVEMIGGAEFKVEFYR